MGIDADALLTAALTVEIAFATAPGDASPTWTDVTSYVQSGVWRRGRAHELDAYSTGSLTLVLRNADRRFEPEYSGSPYYPNVVPVRRVRVRASYNLVTYDLFYGNINNWNVAYPEGRGDADHPADSDTVVSATDGLGVLAMAKLTTSFPQQTSAARIGAVLDAIGWPSADRALGPAQQSVIAAALSDASALSHLQAVVDAENGALWADRSGKIATYNRHNRIQPSPTISATYSDAGQNKAKRHTFSVAADRIVNDARATRDGGILQQVTKPASQTKYYPRALAKSGGLQFRDSDANRQAAWLVGRYPEPLNMLVLAIDPHANGTLTGWAEFLSLDLNAAVNVTKTPPGGGSAISRRYFVDGMEMSFSAKGGEWGASLTLTPADITAYWQLGVAGRSELTTTTLLAY